MDALSRDRASLGDPVADLQPVRRPTREEAMEAVRTLIAWAGDDPQTAATTAAMNANPLIIIASASCTSAGAG